jgi:hypothetical protein
MHPMQHPGSLLCHCNPLCFAQIHYATSFAAKKKKKSEFLLNADSLMFLPACHCTLDVFTFWRFW